jgi:hypothetical protein
MSRPSISVPENEHKAAKREAARLRILLTELVRRSVREILPMDESMSRFAETRCAAHSRGRIACRPLDANRESAPSFRLVGDVFGPGIHSQ